MLSVRISKIIISVNMKIILQIVGMVDERVESRPNRLEADIQKNLLFFWDGGKIE